MKLLCRYWVRTGEIIWQKASSKQLAKLAAEEWSRRLSRPVDIYDRLRFRNIDGDT